MHGVSASTKHFSRKFGGIKLSESTVRSISDAYKRELELKRKQAENDDAALKSLPLKKRGRKVILGEDIDCKVQNYLLKVRDGGGVVSARIAIAAARGILLSCDRCRLVEYGGPVDLSRSWAYSLLHRMKFVRRKASTAKSKVTVSNLMN